MAFDCAQGVRLLLRFAGRLSFSFERGVISTLKLSSSEALRSIRTM
jgi:hypothetical protein